EVFELLEKIRNEFNLTIILVSHETDKILKFCDRVVLLESGMVIFDGITSELLSNENLVNKSGIFNPLKAHEELARTERNIVIKKEPILKISNLSFTYPNQTQALKNISFNINSGDFIAIIGKNGSGKTTLIKHFNGLLKPQVGDIKFKSLSIIEYKISKIAQTIGFCYQNPDHQLFKNTIKEEIEFGLHNLKFPKEEIEIRYNEISELLDLKKFEETYESTFYLSKGIRQRLALASVLVLKPEILIIDEPTTGQDFLMIKEFMKILQDLNDNGHTIIIVTHNPYVIERYSKEVIILDEGKLIKKLPTNDFLKNKELQEIAAFTPI
ncbi:MAG: ATP-binding cassette domain-containing protein, partial [Promethearchaeota archaeon]